MRGSIRPDRALQGIRVYPTRHLVPPLETGTLEYLRCGSGSVALNGPIHPLSEGLQPGRKAPTTLFAGGTNGEVAKRLVAAAFVGIAGEQVAQGVKQFRLVELLAIEPAEPFPAPLAA